MTGPQAGHGETPWSPSPGRLAATLWKDRDVDVYLDLPALDWLIAALRLDVASRREPLDPPRANDAGIRSLEIDPGVGPVTLTRDGARLRLSGGDDERGALAVELADFSRENLDKPGIHIHLDVIWKATGREAAPAELTIAGWQPG